MNQQQIQKTAHACYEANRQYCISIGDNSFVPWKDAPQWQKETNINGVKFRLKNPNATPEDMHKSWMEQKRSEGWKYGAVKDAEKKEHPCFVPYEQLPAAQKFKDYLFITTFNACKAMLETAFTPKEDFKIVEDGTCYHLPLYEVVDGVGIVQLPMEGTDGHHGFHTISFVRGSKLGEENVPKRTGTLHEHLLACMIHDLEFKNKLVPSREGELVITKLQEALGWLRQRQIERTTRGVVGTYQK